MYSLNIVHKKLRKEGVNYRSKRDFEGKNRPQTGDNSQNFSGPLRTISGRKSLNNKKKNNNSNNSLSLSHRFLRAYARGVN